MSSIYIIKNDINDKVYIGLTTRTIETRFREHCRGTQVIDNAIKELGKEHFWCELLEECSEEELNSREIYWINYYNSCNNGYNYTAGGRADDMIFYPERRGEVIDLWNQGFGQKAIVEKTKLNVETVHNYLIKSGITLEDIKNRHRILVGKSKSKTIIQYDLNGKLIEKYSSAAEAHRKTGISRGNISSCANGARKTAGGFIWKKEEGENIYNDDN